MLSVCDGVTNDVLQKDLQNTTGLLVDEARDTLDTTTTSETTNGLSDNKSHNSVKLEVETICIVYIYHVRVW